jgi:hypothetical protein
MCIKYLHGSMVQNIWHGNLSKLGIKSRAYKNELNHLQRLTIVLKKNFSKVFGSLYQALVLGIWDRRSTTNL